MGFMRANEREPTLQNLTRQEAGLLLVSPLLPFSLSLFL